MNENEILLIMWSGVLVEGILTAGTWWLMWVAVNWGEKSSNAIEKLLSSVFGILVCVTGLVI